MSEPGDNAIDSMLEAFDDRITPCTGCDTDIEAMLHEADLMWFDIVVRRSRWASFKAWVLRG